MRLIDADALMDRADEVTFMGFRAVERKKHFVDLVSAMVESCTTIEAVPVVRCKDCKHYWKNKNTPGYLDKCVTVSDDDYCSSGERKEADGK